MLALTSFLVCRFAAAVTSAQAPQRRGPAIDMQLVADSLGGAMLVKVSTCHDRGQVTANGKPRLDVAREMIAMTTELNMGSCPGRRGQDACGKPCAVDLLDLSSRRACTRSRCATWCSNPPCGKALTPRRSCIAICAR
jgi:hypothetical protein